MQRSFDRISNLGIDISDLIVYGKVNSIHNKKACKNISENIFDENKDNADKEQVLLPHEIKEKLDEYIVGQEEAKKILSVAAYNHYKKQNISNKYPDIEMEKSNILMIGPTGCGKTYLVKTLAKILNVPIAIANATTLTKAGYRGDDVESVITKLLNQVDNNVKLAEKGIVFIDEIDKIAKTGDENTSSANEAVQQGLLKLLEATNVDIPIGSNEKDSMVPTININTRNILFICGGAFPGLDEIIKKRQNKESSMGFRANIIDKNIEEENILQKVTFDDIQKFGLIPEFSGRLPIIFSLDELTTEMLAEILIQPKNAILKQYRALLAEDGVLLDFEEDALMAIAEKAKMLKTGARALRSVVEQIMLDIMYEIPKQKNIEKIIITKECINTNSPTIMYKNSINPVIINAGVL